MKSSSGITIIAVLVCLFSFIGCSFNDLEKNGFTFDSDYLYVDVDTISLSDKRQNVSFSIYCMSNWDITNSPKWLSISQLSGGGNSKIDILVEANLEAALREATLFVNLNAIRKPVYIKQASSDYVFNITPSNFSFTKDKEEKPLTIHSNVSWSITHDQDWCHISEYSGNGDNVLSIYCDNNNTNMVRYDTLRVKTSLETIKIPVKQSPFMYYITPTINFLHFGADGGIKPVPVESNTEWTFKSIHSLATPKRINNNEISVSIDKNTTAETRFDTIVFSDIPNAQGAEPTIKEYVYIEQDGLDPVLEIKPDSLTTKPLCFTNKGGEGTFTIESNLKWDVKSSDESWCRIMSDMSGSGNGTIKISVDKNPLGTSKREAAITITTSSLSKVVNIYQEPGEEPYINFTPSTLEDFTNGGGTQSFIVASNVEWTIESTNNSWCHIETPQGTGVGKKDVKIKVDVNPAEAPERNCTLSIKSSWFEDKKVAVRQEKGEKGYLIATSDSLYAKPQGGIVTFEIESNLSSWTVSSNKEWCTVQTTSGSFNGTVSLSATLNSGKTAREDATITIKSAISDVIVIVHQEPKDIPGGDDNPNPHYTRKH